MKKKPKTQEHTLHSQETLQHSAVASKDLFLLGLCSGMRVGERGGRGASPKKRSCAALLRGKQQRGSHSTGGDCSHLVLVPALIIKRDFLNDL